MVQLDEAHDYIWPFDTVSTFRADVGPRSKDISSAGRIRRGSNQGWSASDRLPTYFGTRLSMSVKRPFSPRPEPFLRSRLTSSCVRA